MNRLVQLSVAFAFAVAERRGGCKIDDGYPSIPVSNNVPGMNVSVADAEAVESEEDESSVNTGR